MNFQIDCLAPQVVLVVVFVDLWPVVADHKFSKQK